MKQELLEDPTRFSESLLWKLQRRYFEEQGIKAWQDAEVPHYITSNPFMANAYAEVVFGFFRDQARLNPGSTAKIYLLELGAGSGRFACHFLKCLEQACLTAAWKVPSFCYILSDMAESTIRFWQEHEQLLAFAKKGVLDMAHFDAEKDEEIQLLYSGTQIAKAQLQEPLIIIANYFFDSIPQDLFCIENRQLFEVKTSLYAGAEPVDTARELLSRVEVRFHKTSTKACYEEEGLNAILESYKARFTETVVLFPHVGIRCLERLRGWSQKGFLLLSADKGDHEPEQLDGKDFPEIIRHGSISLTVNYHPMQSFYESKGARVHFTPHRYHSLNIAVALLFPEQDQYKETLAAYNKAIEAFGPDDFFRLKKHFEQHIESMKLWQLQSYIRLSGYDARFVKQCIPHLGNLLTHCSQSDRKDMLLLIRQIWYWYYPIGEQRDLSFDLGILLYSMDLYHEALEFFEISLISYQGNAPVYYNMAACYYQLNLEEKATLYLHKSLELEPDHEGALVLLAEIAGP
jgi:tetratricopeptide (TPR) repeat protein